LSIGSRAVEFCTRYDLYRENAGDEQANDKQFAAGIPGSRRNLPRRDRIQG